MKKMLFPRKNTVIFTALIVKEDARINDKKTRATFRIAAGGGKDQPSCFFDCVMFAKEDKPLPVDLLKKGAKVELEGYFRMNSYEFTAQDGTKKTHQGMEIVVNDIKENAAVEVEVPDEDAQKLPAGQNLTVEAAPASVADELFGEGDMPEDLGDL